jgi:hypothetical protein
MRAGLELDRRGQLPSAPASLKDFLAPGTQRAQPLVEGV